MMNWLIAVVMWCSVVVGWILAIVASEELAVGKRYFEWLRIGLFFSTLIIFSYSLFKNVGIFLLVLLLLGVGSGIIHIFLTKVSFWQEFFFAMVCFIWATIVVLVVGEEFIETGLLFVSLFFIYGIVVGTLLNIKYRGV